jgi:hypothetical protein
MSFRAVTRLPLLVLLGASLAACDVLPDPAEPVRDPARITMAVEIDHDIVDVLLGPLEPAGDGSLQHEIFVEWLGVSRAILDDARFTHHVAGDPAGDLVLAGRGCGADWDEATEMVVHICTQDLLLIELEPGESHPYPIRIHSEVGPLQLTPGQYTVEETIGWEQDGEQGEFTLTLTYDVE